MKHFDTIWFAQLNIGIIFLSKSDNLVNFSSLNYTGNMTKYFAFPGMLPFMVVHFLEVLWHELQGFW